MTMSNDAETSCPCKRTKCERHGDCTACRAGHSKSGTLTICERLKLKSERKAEQQRKKKEE